MAGRRDIPSVQFVGEDVDYRVTLPSAATENVAPRSRNTALYFGTGCRKSGL
jgi:hypothetical protein